MTLLWVAGAALVLLAVGTAVGRLYVPHSRPLKQEAQEGRSYARGLVNVLEGNGSAAIGELTEALKRNTRTVEAYFALGTLFRQQREYERAVRVHQSILMRRDIDKATRLRVHAQLARDFAAAGFERRAVKALEWIVAHDSKNATALRDLSEMLQRVGQWRRAALVARRWGRVSGEDVARLVAHLYARAAEQDMELGKVKEARAALRKGASASPQSLHLLHALGTYHRTNGNAKAAYEAWRRAVKYKPDLATFFLPDLQKVASELRKPQVLSGLLDELNVKHPTDLHVQLARVRHVASKDPQAALALVSPIIAAHPKLLPARREAAELVLRTGDAAAIRKALGELLDALSRAGAGFRCAGCGHWQDGMFWQCPHCRACESAGVAWGRRGTERPDKRA